MPRKQQPRRKQSKEQPPRKSLPRWVLLLLAAGLIYLVVLLRSITSPEGTVPALMTFARELVTAGLIVTAAGGFGWVALRRIMPPTVSTGLRVVTSTALGLWILSTAMLIFGTAGVLDRWFWWVIVAAGVLLAAGQASPTFRRWRLRAKSDEAGKSGASMWIIAAIAAAVWTAGVTLPPGLIGGANAYDVLEYHLQVPREFYNYGQIHDLYHNVYSFYPLGVEMQYLLGMVLRGGAFEGVYLAKMMHGIHAALAAAGVYFALRKTNITAARTAAGLLLSAPLIHSLGWMAFVELAQVLYLAVALLWLREWIERRNWRSAVLIGSALGAACATKYLAIPFVAGPVILAMVALAIRRQPRRSLWQAALAVLLTALLFSPWIVRNLIATSNPVFPLATDIFGHGHWDAVQAQRWQVGHSPEGGAPVPELPGLMRKEPQPRSQLLLDNLLLSRLVGPATVILAFLAVPVMLALKDQRTRWRLTLVGILALQVVLWMALTRGMPTRFLTPALVPMCLLGGWLIGVRAQSLRNRRPDPQSPKRETYLWLERLQMGGLLALLVGSNFLFAAGQYRQAIPAGVDTRMAHGLDPSLMRITTQLQDDRARIGRTGKMIALGDARAMLYPAGSLYATAFDMHPLIRLYQDAPSHRKLLERLRSKGYTHIVVNWKEIWRLAGTYGTEAELSSGLIGSYQRGEYRPQLTILRNLRRAGLQRVADIGGNRRLAPTTNPAGQTRPWDPFGYPPYWPEMSVYRIPDLPTTATTQPPQ